MPFSCALAYVDRTHVGRQHRSAASFSWPVPVIVVMPLSFSSFSSPLRPGTLWRWERTVGRLQWLL